MDTHKTNHKSGHSGIQRRRGSSHLGSSLLSGNSGHELSMAGRQRLTDFDPRLRAVAAAHVTRRCPVSWPLFGGRQERGWPVPIGTSSGLLGTVFGPFENWMASWKTAEVDHLIGHPFGRRHICIYSASLQAFQTTWGGALKTRLMMNTGVAICLISHKRVTAPGARR